MKLTAVQQAYVAQRAQWYFDVQPYGRARTVSSSSPVETTVFTGDGVEDLTQLINYLQNYPKATITAEVGQALDLTISPPGSTPGNYVALANAFPKYLPVDTDDIAAIKTYYIAYYGTVNKPNVYASPSGAAQELPVAYGG